MGADLPDEADESPDGHADRRDDEGGGGQPFRPGSTDAETRNREEYYADLRTTVSTEESTTVRRITAEEQAGAKKWGKSIGESRWMWTEYQRRWLSEERSPVKRPDDASGSWRGEGNRSLKPEANGRVEAACDQIADREREKISPAMRAIESQGPDRHLIGFEHRLKDRDRIKGQGSAEVSGTSDAPLSRLFLVCQTRFAIPLSIGRLATLRVSGQTSDALRGRLSAAQSMECVVEGSVQGNQQPVDRSGERPAVRSTVPHPHQLRGQAAHASCLRTAKDPTAR